MDTRDRSGVVCVGAVEKWAWVWHPSRMHGFHPTGSGGIAMLDPRLPAGNPPGSGSILEGWQP